MTGEELRAALGRPDPYPGAVREVDVRETHISWVFLAGSRAYKLKKPLVLPFVDYGTPQRRLEMCREEVRLNRRLAEDIYLGVRGVAPTGSGSVELVDENDPRAVDFVVEMVRYDERATVRALLARGELKLQDLEQVGGTLAAFHDRCPVLAVPEGGARRATGELERNLYELLTVAEPAGERIRIAALRRFLGAYVSAHRQELDDRAERGLVRDVHGDIRAEHVLLDGQVRVLDCVEFEPTLRALDTADDLAYLVMDLAWLGGERFGSSLVKGYRAAGGDCGGEPLLSFFAVHRALVRAKVLLTRAAQHPPGSAAHGHANAGAREVLSVAERFAWRARLPLAIVICGVPASGKSHLTAELARASGLPEVASDPIRKELAGIEPGQRAPPSRYSSEFSRLTYSELGSRAARELRSGGGVLVDATFRRRSDRDAFRESFADAGPIVFVECRAPTSLLARRARLRERAAESVSDAGLAVVLRESGRWEPLDEIPPGDRFWVRTDRAAVDLIKELSAMLDRRLARRALDP